MHITFLGTNGWFSTPTGDTPCILIQTKKFAIVLDAGNGIYKLSDYIDESKPVYLFLSHLHLDHVEGLHMLNKFRFSRPLTIYVPKGMKKPLTTLLNQPFSMPLHELKYQTNLQEIDEGTVPAPFPFTAIPLFHSSLNFGYRFELEGKIISYSGDTGICENSKKLAVNADVLIHECTYEVGHAKSNWGHVNPLEVAALARDSHVKKLLLTHFDASTYTSLTMRREAEKAAQKLFPNTRAAADGMQIEL